MTTGRINQVSIAPLRTIAWNALIDTTATWTALMQAGSGLTKSETLRFQVTLCKLCLCRDQRLQDDASNIWLSKFASHYSGIAFLHRIHIRLEAFRRRLFKFIWNIIQRPCKHLSEIDKPKLKSKSRSRLPWSLATMSYSSEARRANRP